ncbi:MAG: SIR2 family protein, partial [Flavobacterium sp.]|nr:SIR2 family protein [Flavobacterium sp.]
NDLEKLIRDRFEDKTKPTETHDVLVKIKAKFLITTNYDTLIEKALVKNFNNYFPTVYTYKDASSINYSLWNNDHFVLKAHGDAKTPKEIVLTERDYRNIIYNQSGYLKYFTCYFFYKFNSLCWCFIERSRITIVIRIYS